MRYGVTVGGEPIQIHSIYGLDRRERWRHGGSFGGWQSYSISVGVLPDGRWYSHHTERGHRHSAWAWPDEDTARAHLAELKTPHDDWIEVPAAYDATMRPATPGPWIRVGSSWRRPQGDH